MRLRRNRLKKNEQRIKEKEGEVVKRKQELIEKVSKLPGELWKTEEEVDEHLEFDPFLNNLVIICMF